MGGEQNLLKGGMSNRWRSNITEDQTLCPLLYITGNKKEKYKIDREIPIPNPYLKFGSINTVVHKKWTVTNINLPS